MDRNNIKNPNHPKKDSAIKVEQIRELRDIKSIKKLLADNPRNLCLFTLGINTNLRASLICSGSRGPGGAPLKSATNSS